MITPACARVMAARDSESAHRRWVHALPARLGEDTSETGLPMAPA